MKKVLTKQNIIILAIVVLFIVAIVVNVKTNKAKETAKAEKGTESETAAFAGGDYYTAFRSNRDSVRAKEVEYLEQILSQEDTAQETIDEANSKKLEIIACMESELAIESAIKSKGFTDAAVTFHKGSVNVIIDSEQIDKKQAAQILDIVMRETGEPAENIKISLQR